MSCLRKSKSIPAKIKALRLPVRASLRVAFLILTLLILTLLGTGLAQQLADSIGSQSAEVIREVSRYFSDTPLVDAHLTRAGFTVTGPAADWRRMPAVRKIETAYLAAQNVSQAEADRLLWRLAKETVTAYEPARFVPVLAELSGRDTPGAVRFAALVRPPDPRIWSPPPAAQKAILEISRYADGGSLGGVANLMQFYLRVPEHDAYQILRSSNDSADAIQRAMNFVPEAERNPRLYRIIDDLSMTHPDIRKAAVISAFLNSDRRNNNSPGTQTADGPARPDNPRPPSGGPGGGGGGSPIQVERAGAPPVSREAEVRRAEVTYEQFHSTRYPTPGTRVYETAIAFEGGFGGVVFGAPVTVAPELKGRIDSLVWLPPGPEDTRSGKRGLGQLMIRMKGGEVAILPGVDPEDAYAARIIVFGGDGIKATPEGELVGLVGLRGDDQHQEVVNDRIKTVGERFHVVIHPAIATSNLGQSVAMTDALPIEDGITSLAKARVSAKEAQQVAAVWAGLANWKITDAPLSVGVSSGSIEVHRTTVPRGENDAYARSMFLSMVGFARFGSGDAAKGKFENAEPLLVKSSEDFARLNHFAAVLAVFRAVRAQKGELVNPPLAIGDLPAIDYLVVSPGSYKFLNSTTLPGIQALDDLSGRLVAIEQQMPTQVRASARTARQPWAAYLDRLKSNTRRDSETEEANGQRSGIEWAVDSAAEKAGQTQSLKKLRDAYSDARYAGLFQEKASSAQTLNDARAKLIALETRLVPELAAQIASSHSEHTATRGDEDRLAPLPSRWELMEHIAGALPTSFSEFRTDAARLKSLEEASHLLDDQIRSLEGDDDYDPFGETRIVRARQALKNSPARLAKLNSLIHDREAANDALDLAGTDAEEAAAEKRAEAADAGLQTYIDGITEVQAIEKELAAKTLQSDAVEKQIHAAQDTMAKHFAAAVPQFENWYGLLNSVQMKAGLYDFLR